MSNLLGPFTLVDQIRSRLGALSDSAMNEDELFLADAVDEIERLVSALKLTERNLSSLIAAHTHDAKLLMPWRDVVREAIGLN